MTYIDQLNSILKLIEIGDPIKYAFSPKLEFVCDQDFECDINRPAFRIRCLSKNAQHKDGQGMNSFVSIAVQEDLFEDEIIHMVSRPDEVAKFVFRQLMKVLEHELKESLFVNGEYLYDPHPELRRFGLTAQMKQQQKETER